MRILLTADPFIPVPPVHYGGIERIVASLAVHFQELGHAVGLLAHPDSQCPAGFLAKWPSTDPRQAGDHVRNTLALVNTVREFRPDVVHSFSRLLYLAPLLPSRLSKVMSYQRQPGGRQIAVGARLAGRSLIFTGCSGFIAAAGRRAGGNWRAIPNFVDTAALQFKAAVPDDAPLVFLSRIEAIKGTHLAIEIAKRTGRRLKIAGNFGATEADRKYWDELIQPELNRNGIEYVGVVDDVAKNALLGSAAAMLVPIQWEEPFGIVFAEALSCGTPVIACPRGALPEIVRDGVEGRLINTIEEGCEAVRSLPAISREKCRARAESEFSLSVVAQRYLATYQGLRNQTAGRRG